MRIEARYNSTPPNGKSATIPPRPKSEIKERPHEAHPVATSVMSPVPNVNLRLPCPAKNLIFRITRAMFAPKRRDEVRRSTTSSGVMVWNAPQKSVHKILTFASIL